MTVTLKFSGGLELQAALKDLADKALSRRTATRALKRAAEPIRDKAQELAPDDPATGLGKYLKEAIKIGDRQQGAAQREFRQSSAGRKIVEQYVGIDGSVLPPKEPKTERRRKRKGGGSSGGGVAAYSIFQEFGTSSMPAKPYMTPAWEQEQGTALERIKTDLWDEIQKSAKRQARKRAKAAG